MTVLWHLLLYWFIQPVIHPQKANLHNLKVTSINWPLLIKHKIIPIQGILNIMGNNADKDADVTEVPVAMETEETPITGMIIKIEVPDAVKDNGTFNTIEGKGKTTHFEVDEGNWIEMTLITVTETIGIENPKVKVILTGVEDGIIIIEVKDIVIGVEGEDGIPISTIMIQGINNKPNFQTQIIIVHHLWDSSIGTRSHMSNTHTPSNNNNNITPQCCKLHHNKPQICVSCVIIKDITIISANLQATLWPAHKKPSVKADHTSIKTRIMGNGHMVTMMTMTLMGNLFSSGGSRCH